MIEYSEPKRRSQLEAGKPVEREKEFDSTLVNCIPALRKEARRLTRLTGDSHLAKDLVQTALEKAMHDREKFLDAPTNQSAMESWMTVILQNTFRDHWRHVNKNVEDGRKEAQDAVEITDDQGKESGDALDQRRTVQRALDIMSGLTPRQRQAMELTILEGKEEREVANAMRTGIGSVKTQLSRGRANIVNQLTPDDLDIIRSATNKPLRGTGAEGVDNLEP